MMNKIIRKLNKHNKLLKGLLTNEELILNYQEGKVGSSTVAEYLNKNGYLEWHIHRFTNIPILCNRNKNKISFFMDLFFLKLYLNRDKNIKIFSGYRDPVARNISMFFQLLASDYTKYINNDNYDIEKITDIFFNKFPHNGPLNWFDKEFKEIIDVNIYNYNFDKDKGYTIIRKDNLSVFLYKLESLNNLEREIKNFLGDSNYKLLGSNIGSEKWYAPLYKDFKEQFNPPEEYISNLYNTDIMKYFYTDLEIEKFRNKWLNNN